MKIGAMFSKIWKVIFPENIKCAFCGKELFDKREVCVCEECLSKLSKIENPCLKCGVEIDDLAQYCDICKNQKHNFTKAIACFSFEEFERNIIYKLKYDDGKYLAKTLAHFMAEKLKAESLDIDIVVPVPLATKRKKNRGYNQSELLAKEVCNLVGLKFENDVVLKTKETSTQTSLGYRKRAENLKDSFKICDKEKVKRKSVLIIDDVFTTGATANEIAKQLRTNGAKDVYVLTFCHTKFDKI